MASAVLCVLWLGAGSSAQGQGSPVRSFAVQTLAAARAAEPQTSEARTVEAPVPEARAPEVDAQGWSELGSFQGAAGSRLLAALSDSLFEKENEGGLYQDLSDVSLGLSKKFDNIGRIEWDNSFFRQVVPFHDALGPDELIESSDLSRYMDVKTVVTRGRVRYNYLPDLTSYGGIGAQVEGGRSLTLAHAHDPLPLGHRPLDQVLAEERSDSLADRFKDQEPMFERSLIRLSSEGVAQVADWIARGLNRGTADTERGAVFYEGYADPITQFIDLGIPIEAELFTSKDDRLRPGDRVREITFIGLSPIGGRARKYGFEVSFRHYYRYLRETTVIKGENDEVLVVVRNALALGNEFIPLKIRPEVRVLGILKLGYTFFEQIYDRANTRSWQVIYRIDLSSPEGMESFRGLLGEAGSVNVKPMAHSAAGGGGVELLYSEVRVGKRSVLHRRAKFFSWLSSRDHRMSINERITTENVTLREIVRSRESSFRKHLGRDREWRKQFVVSAQGNLRPVGEDFDSGPSEDLTSAVTLVSSLREESAEAPTVQRAIDFLGNALPWDAPPEGLRDVASPRPGEDVRLSVNLLLSFNREHLARLQRVDENALWVELANILIGSEYRHVWSTPGRRDSWRSNPTFSAAPYVDLAPQLPLIITGSRRSPKPMPLLRRFKLARKTARHFERLQGLMAQETCLSCITRAFDRWRSVGLMQTLMLRLAWDEDLDSSPATPDGDQPGYFYEFFTDRMSRPIRATNDIRHSFPSDWNVASGLLAYSQEPQPEVSARPEDADAFIDNLDKDRWDWLGSESFLSASTDRLQAGRLLANSSSAAGEPCWKLRLFTDHLFGDALRLRADLRRSGNAIVKDKTLSIRFFDLGVPTALEESPFRVARYFFEVPIDAELEEEAAYTLLLRVLNPDGYPVTEEQQLRFRVPRGMGDRMPPSCRPAPAPQRTSR